MAHDALTDRFDRERRWDAILAAALVVVLSSYAVLLSLTSGGGTPSAGTSSDRLLMSAVIAAVSGAGIIAAFRPSRCLGILSPGRRMGSAQGLPERAGDHPSYPLVAHHCSCGLFSDHTLRLGGRSFCAGCLGMAAGGVCGIGLGVASAAGLFALGGTSGLVATLLAVAVSSVGLALLYRPSPPGVHAAANLALVAGAVLLAVLLSNHGLQAGVFGLLAALALVGLRIEMSRLRHLSVYAGCPRQGDCRGASALETARRPTRR